MDLRRVSFSHGTMVPRYCQVLMACLYSAIATVIWLEQSFGEPIDCKLHGEVKYTETNSNINQTCWISNLYVKALDKNIPWDKNRRYSDKISYHGNVPYFLGLQALLTCLPWLIWIHVGENSKLDLKGIISTMNQREFRAKEHRHRTLHRRHANAIHRWIKTKRRIGIHRPPTYDFRRHLNNCWLFVSGRQLVAVYSFIRTLCLTISVAQIFLTSRFLNFDFTTYGFSEFLNTEDQTHFPEMVHCNVPVFINNNNVRISAICVLRQNQLLQKVFLFFWFSVICAISVNAYKLLLWVVRLKDSRISYFVDTYADMVYDKSPLDVRGLFEWVVENYLRQDGVFILRKIARDTDDDLMTELTLHIMARFNPDLKRLMLEL